MKNTYNNENHKTQAVFDKLFNSLVPEYGTPDTIEGRALCFSVNLTNDWLNNGFDNLVDIHRHKVHLLQSIAHEFGITQEMNIIEYIVEVIEDDIKSNEWNQSSVSELIEDNLGYSEDEIEELLDSLTHKIVLFVNKSAALKPWLKDLIENKSTVAA